MIAEMVTDLVLTKGQPGTGSLMDELIAWWILDGEPLVNQAILPGLAIPLAQGWAADHNEGWEPR